MVLQRVFTLKWLIISEVRAGSGNKHIILTAVSASPLPFPMGRKSTSAEDSVTVTGTITASAYSAMKALAMIAVQIRQTMRRAMIRRTAMPEVYRQMIPEITFSGSCWCLYRAQVWQKLWFTDERKNTIDRLLKRPVAFATGCFLRMQFSQSKHLVFSCALSFEII